MSTVSRTPPKISAATSDPELCGHNLGKITPNFVNPRKKRLLNEGDDSTGDLLLYGDGDAHATCSGITMESLDDWKSQLQVSIVDTIVSTVQRTISEQMGKVTSSIETLQKDVKALSSEFKSMERCAGEIQLRVSTLENALPPGGLESIKTEHNKQITSLQNQNTQLAKRLDDFEQFSRQANLEIRNLPERKNENLLSIVEGIGKIVKVAIQPTDIVFAHRVPHAHTQPAGSAQSPKNVIVKFYSRTLRDSVIAASKLHRGGIDIEHLVPTKSPTKIFINEHLTLQKKALLRQTKMKCSEKKYKYVWIKNASIMCRKEDTSPVLFIKTEQDLSKIT